MLRRPAATRPDTYTAGEVGGIFHGDVNERGLADWDERGWFRPSFYEDREAPGGVIPPAERDKRMRNRGAPGRRYTFIDLLWLGLFIHVKKVFVSTGVANPVKRASKVIEALRKEGDDRIPSRSRLLFLRENAYLLEEGGTVRPVGDAKQLALTGVFAADLAAKVQGRIEVLAARSELHSVLTVDNAKNSLGSA
jgi:hypothetical protein